MSEVYQGEASNVTIGKTATITGIGAGPDSIVTTSAAHEFQTGDLVTIEGVTGTGSFEPVESSSSINNLPGYAWTITITGADTFTIDNGSTTGAYVSGGTATDLSCLPPATIVNNGDSFDADAAMAPIETALDRTQALAAMLMYAYSQTFLANGSWVCPPGCTHVHILMCGGGGGGDASCSQSSADGYQAAQGGGGAGAQLVTVDFATIPGHTYNITIGVGGSSGVFSPAAQSGDGGATFIIDSVDADSLAIALGGAGAGPGFDVFATFGYAVQSGGAGNPCVMVAPGGRGTSTGSVPTAQRDWPWIDPANAIMRIVPNSDSAIYIDNQRYCSLEPGSGGACIAAHTITTSLTNFPQGASLPGQPSVGMLGGIWPGGSPGDQGAPAGSHLGGPGGGGGGGGAFGAGGNGGNGGAASSGGTGSTGVFGGNAAANSGGGGGGAGPGGGGATGGAGSDGGGGGSGQLILFWNSNLGGA
jgi:hypothetical protein